MKRVLYVLLAMIIFAAVAGVFMQAPFQPGNGASAGQPYVPKMEISAFCKQFAASEQESCSKAIKLVELSVANSAAYKAEKAESGEWIVYVESAAAPLAKELVTPTGQKIGASDIEPLQAIKSSYLVDKNGNIMPKEIIR